MPGTQDRGREYTRNRDRVYVHEDADKMKQVRGKPGKKLTTPSHAYMNKRAGRISNTGHNIITGTTDFIFDRIYDVFIASIASALCGPGRRD